MWFQMVNNSRASNGWLIKGLEADGPDPNLKEKLMLFGQFVGDWDIVEARYTQADGTEVKMKGEVHFGWILGGTAIQDVWIGYPESSQKVILLGRLFDSMTKRLMLGVALGSLPSRDLYKLSSPRRLVMRLILQVKLLKVTRRNGYFLRLHHTLSDGIPRKHMATIYGFSLRKCRSEG